jgi:asparagine synthetase B (glutamine-hydrolysing)
MPDRTFGVALSGGMDSSTLWGVIAARARRGDGRAAGGHPYSFVLPGFDCDETARIRLICEFTSSEGSLVDVSGESLHGSLDELARTVDGLHVGSLFLPRAIARAAQRDNRTAMLLGVGGDEWLYGKLTYLADELRSGHPLRVLRDLWRFREGDSAARFQMLLGYGAVGWRRWIRRRSPAVRPSWLHPSRALPAPAIDAQIAEANGGPPGSRSRRALLGTLLSVQNLHQRDTEEQLFAAHGLEQRLPLLDLDLVELVFELPGRAITGGRRPKDLLRRWARSVLPAAIVERQVFVDYESAICRELGRFEELMPPGDWRLVEAGVADAGGLRGVFERARRPGAARTMLPGLIVAEALVRRFPS